MSKKKSFYTETSVLLATVRQEIILEKGGQSIAETKDVSAFTMPCLQLPST